MSIARLLLTILCATVCVAQGQILPPQYYNSAVSIPVVNLSNAGSPFIFQHIASSTNPGGSGEAGRAYVLSTEALPANTVAVMGVTAPQSVTTVSISDTLVGSWSAAVCTAPGGTGNEKAWIFVQNMGGTGGVDKFTVNVGGTNVQPVQFDVTFYENINTSTPVNNSLCVGAITPTSGGVVSPGTFTPVNNNLSGGTVIWNYTPLAVSVSNTTVTGYTPATSFSLLNGGAVFWPVGGFPQASQYYTQTTAATVTPSITIAGENATNGDIFNSATISLNVANNHQTAPTSIHVVKILHESSYQATCAACTTTGPFPTLGNLRVLATTWPGGCQAGGGACLGPAGSSVTSSDGCTWTVIGNYTNGDAVQAYAQNCSPCPTCTISITYAGTGNLGGSFRLYDIQNANTSSYQNEVSGNASCSATQTDQGTITPAVSAGLTIADNGIGTGPGLAVTSPTGATFDLWNFTGQTDGDDADNADLQAHYYFSTNAVQNWNWSLNAASSCYWVDGVYK